jgi:hypothetical protein
VDDLVALTASQAYGDEGASLLLVTLVTVSTETYNKHHAFQMAFILN